MTDLPAISTNTEDYLEAILRLIAEKGAARVRDLAAALAVHKSTVSLNLKTLAEKGLVKYSPYEIATLTALGQEIAEDVQRRHQVIGRFLTDVLGLNNETAQANACRMEHILDPEVLERFGLLADFVKTHAAKGDLWIQQFQQHAKSKLRSRLKKEEHQPPSAGKPLATLDQLEPGGRGGIVKVGGAGAVKRRMADMGMTRGTTVEVVKVAPLGDRSHRD